MTINRPSIQPVYVCVVPHFSRRLTLGQASKGHTGERSRKISQPAGLALVLLQKGCSHPLHVDRQVEFCARTINRPTQDYVMYK